MKRCGPKHVRTFPQLLPRKEAWLIRENACSPCDAVDARRAWSESATHVLARYPEDPMRGKH